MTSDSVRTPSAVLQELRALETELGGLALHSVGTLVRAYLLNGDAAAALEELARGVAHEEGDALVIPGIGTSPEEAIDSGFTAEWALEYVAAFALLGRSPEIEDILKVLDHLVADLGEEAVSDDVLSRYDALQVSLPIVAARGMALLSLQREDEIGGDRLRHLARGALALDAVELTAAYAAEADPATADENPPTEIDDEELSHLRRTANLTLAVAAVTARQHDELVEALASYAELSEVSWEDFPELPWISLVRLASDRAAALVPADLAGWHPAISEFALHSAKPNGERPDHRSLGVHRD